MFRLAGRFICILPVIFIVASCASHPKVEQTTTPPASAVQATSVDTAQPSPTPEGYHPPTSSDLIDAALEKGEIDPVTALKYKLFEQYKDPRLPAEFTGNPEKGPDSHIIDDLQAQYASLSPADRAELAPFLVPPVYRGSWGDPTFAPNAPGGSSGGGNNKIDQGTPFAEKLPCDYLDQENWESTTSLHSPVRFWWQKSRPADGEAAQRFITAMDDEVWPRLTGLMGRAPKSDAGYECNGGSADLDVYITPEVSRSYAAALYPPGCKDTPSYLVLNPGISNAILAHEFMHAVQWSYNTAVDCMYPGNYAWLAEATASWSQNYVYPDDNEEHAYIPWFFDGGSPPNLDLRNDQHEYGAHLFFFFLTNKFGQPDLVKSIWDNTQSNPSVDAVDKVIPGGFKDNWAEFAVKNIDEPPDDEYQRWDNMNIKPSGGSLTRTENVSPGDYVLTSKIDSLSISYDWFTFGEDARLVTFFNGLTNQLDEEPINTFMGNLPINDGSTQYKFTPAKDVEGVKIQAYFKVTGDIDWQLEDWTDKPYMAFCRDAQKEKLTDLIIVTSNSSTEWNYSAPGKYNPILKVSDLGCYRYGGSASLLFTGAGEGGSFADQQELPNVAFERTDEHPNIPYPILRFKVAEGSVDRSYNYTGTDNGCQGSGDDHTHLIASPKTEFGNDLFILYGAVSGDSLKRYSGEANMKRSISVNYQCPDGSTTESIPSQPWFYADVLSQVLEKKYIAKDGGALEGSGDLLQEADNAAMSYEWKFVPLAQTGSEGSSSSSASGSSSGGSDGSSGGTSSPPGSASADIPTYPNIETVVQNASGSGYSFTTNDAPDDVAQFYRDAYLNLGWTDLSSSAASLPGGQIMLVFSSDRKIISIMINQVDDRTMVNLYEVGS